MIAAVVDTNILIRGFIRPQGSAGEVLDSFRRGKFLLVYSEPLLSELLETLALPRIKHKYQLRDEEIEALADLLVLRGELVLPSIRVTICRDVADNKVLEAAEAARADYIVTADNDLLVLQDYRGVAIVPARRFLDALRDHEGNDRRSEGPTGETA